MSGDPIILNLRGRLAVVAASFPPEGALTIEIAGRRRTGKLTISSDAVYSYKVLADLLDNGLADLLARGTAEEINHLLTRVCGRDISLAGLGLTPPERTL